ncbi:MAG: TonB C-terminal domain-containing protein [Gemmatimonadota bacterium]|nr:MAG: TonB C-terminal domain-containing protein [Gemmatimonadota bacterium]
MARLIVRRESRGTGDGLPPSAVVGSMSLHTVVLIFMIWGAHRIDLPESPQIYRVELVAAPRPAPVRTMPVPERQRATPREEPEARPVETQPEPEAARQQQPAPVEAEPEAGAEEPEPAVEERAAAPPEQAPGGTDLPVRLEGAPFPYPEYLANVILQIKRHWRPPTGGRQLRAELAFTILRDGSVEGVAWVRRSGEPAFDLEARGAIEAAGRRGAFGPLPEDYPADQLRVSFFFDPTRY